MKKIAPLAFIVLAVSLTANAAEWKSAGPFPTAQEAADFANSLSARSRLLAQFVCESGNDLPASSTYRVFYYNTDAPMDDSGFRWEAAADLADVETAVALANEKLAWPGFAACWNAQKNPERALTTLFYIANKVPENHPYHWQLADRSFPTAEAAADYANQNLTPNEIWTAQFVPEFFSATQTANSWKIVFIGAGPFSQPVRWRVVTQNQEFPLEAESALVIVNAVNGVPRFSTAVTVTRTQSQIVLFLLEVSEESEPRPETQEPEAKLEIPTTVYASRRLISERDPFVAVAAQDGAKAAQEKVEDDNPTKCCSELIVEIQNAADDPLLRAAKITAFVDGSRQAKTEIKAGVAECYFTEGPHIAFCRILITEKLFRNFDDDELFGALAHEAKHVSQQLNGQDPDGSIEREYDADKFAMVLLGARGRRKTAIVTGLKKALKEGGFTTSKRLKQIKLRIINAEKLLSAREYPAACGGDEAARR